MCSEPDGSLCDLDLANVMYVENLITIFRFMCVFWSIVLVKSKSFCWGGGGGQKNTKFSDTKLLKMLHFADILLTLVRTRLIVV